MTDTTYDGQEIAREAPFGATVVVYRLAAGGDFELLILHRAHQGREYEGDWAWTPPAGARWPGESPDQCARRELREETGLQLQIRPVDVGSHDWRVYLAEAPQGAIVSLDQEHDRYEWLSLKTACSRCAPEKVAAQLHDAMASLTKPF